MRGLKKQRRIQIVALAAVALTLSAALIGYAMRDGINFFRTPTQVAEAPPPAGEVFRIGGLVADGTLIRDQSETVTFEVTDGNAAIPVAYTGVLPDLFGEGEGAVALGSLENGVFVATEVLARHDETYMPKEVIDALQEQGIYVDPETGERSAIHSEAPSNGATANN
ncbi:MAG: cytochrome c maturation protein CcmE [Dinoroseobacter sp.]|nr:cytochrome c maturation protein CcmE [Dinoroseobacter sp.]